MLSDHSDRDARVEKLETSVSSLKLRVNMLSGS